MTAIENFFLPVKIEATRSLRAPPHPQPARQDPGNVNPSEVSQRFTSQHTDSALPNHLEIPLLETSGQTTIKTGTKSYPSKKKKKMKGQKWRSKVKTSKTELVKRK